MDAVAAALASNPNSNLSPQLKDKHVQRLRALRQRLQALKQLRTTWPAKTPGNGVDGVEGSTDESTSTADRTVTPIRRGDGSSPRVTESAGSPGSAGLVQESHVTIPGSYGADGGYALPSDHLGSVATTLSDEGAGRGENGATRSIIPAEGGEGGVGTDDGAHRERHGVGTGLGGGEVDRESRDAGGNENSRYNSEFKQTAADKPRQEGLHAATQHGRFDRGSAAAEPSSPLLVAVHGRTEKGEGETPSHVDIVRSGGRFETQGTGNTKGASANGDADLRAVGGNRNGDRAGDTGGDVSNSENTSLVAAGDVGTRDIIPSSESHQEVDRFRNNAIELHHQRGHVDTVAAGNGSTGGAVANDYHGGDHDAGGREKLQGAGNHGGDHASTSIENGDDGVGPSDNRGRSGVGGVEALHENATSSSTSRNTAPAAGASAAAAKHGGSNRKGVGGGVAGGGGGWGGDGNFDTYDHAVAAGNSSDERGTENDGRRGDLGGAASNDDVRGESGSGGQTAAGQPPVGDREGSHRRDGGDDSEATRGGSKSGHQTNAEGGGGEKHSSAGNRPLIGRQARVAGEIFGETMSGDPSAAENDDDSQSTADGNFSPGRGGIVRDTSRGDGERGDDENGGRSGDENQVGISSSHRDGHGSESNANHGEGVHGDWGAVGNPPPRIDERLADGYDEDVRGSAVDGKRRAKNTTQGGDQGAPTGGLYTGVAADDVRDGRIDAVGASPSRDESMAGNQESAEHGTGQRKATGIRQHHQDADAAGEAHGGDASGGRHTAAAAAAAINGTTNEPATAGYRRDNDAGGVTGGGHRGGRNAPDRVAAEPTGEHTGEIGLVARRATDSGAEDVAGGRVKGDSRALSTEEGVGKRATGNALGSNVGDANGPIGHVVPGAGGNKNGEADRAGDEVSQDDRQKRLLVIGRVPPAGRAGDAEDDGCSVVSSVSDDAGNEGMAVAESDEDGAGEGAGVVGGRQERRGTGGVSGEAGGPGGVSAASAKASTRSRHQVLA